MSVYVSAWVWKHSKAESTQLLVLLALADQANDDGACWPSVKTIAARCRLKGRAVQENIRLAEKSGELKIFYQQGPHGTNIYQFPNSAPDAPSRTLHLAHPAPERVSGVQNGAYESVREPSITTTKSVPVVPLGVDPILEEFGPFSAPQRLYIADQFERNPDYVQRQAEIVRSEPRENLAAALLAALKDDWQPARKSVKASPKPKYWKPDPVEGLCTGDKATEGLKALRSAIG